MCPTSDETSEHGIYVFNQLHPDIKCSVKSACSYRLITTDYPLYHESVRDSLQSSWDLVDMEGYAFASFAKMRNLPLRVWKGISDLAIKGGELSIVDSLPKLSERLANLVSLAL